MVGLVGTPTSAADGGGARPAAAEHGRVFDVAGGQVAAFPGPDALLAVESVPGLPQTKVDRLHAVARAAAEGLLDAQRLRALGPEEAHIQLQTLPGIGPFYASLIVLRAVGFPDVPVTDEPLALELMGQLYASTVRPRPRMWNA